MRKTAHVFGAVSLEDADFTYRFAPVFNGHTFHQFLLQLTSKYGPRKLFLVIDNGPCHWLDDVGKAWLAANSHKLELHRLPGYSPEFNPVEGVWKATRKVTTHNRARLGSASHLHPLSTLPSSHRQPFGSLPMIHNHREAV